jgi:hypothetical protein
MPPGDYALPAGTGTLTVEMSDENARLQRWLMPAAAASATTAAFCKQFTPLYHLHSTIIFVVAAFTLSLMILPVLKLRPMTLVRSRAIAVALLGLWACAGVSYVLFARQIVPPTYLAGFFLLSGFFVPVGLMASNSLRTVAVLFLAMALIDLFYLARYVAYFGFLFPPEQLVDQFQFPKGFGDIFGVSIDPEADRVDLYITLYQSVGRFVGLGSLALLFLVGNEWGRRVAACIAMAMGLAVILWIGARGAALGLVAAVSTSIFVNRGLPLRKRFLVFGVGLLVGVALLITMKIGFNSSIPAIDRTVDEILHPNERQRGAILGHLVQVLRHEPSSVILGRGLGMFPVELGRKTPNWLFDRGTELSYPHNIVLEALYEAGIGGTICLIVLLAIPIWRARTMQASLGTGQVFVLQTYVFYLASMMVSGALAYSYDFYFVLGLAVGSLRSPAEALDANAVSGPG